MSKEKRLIPKLRFPEFNGNDEWKLEFVNTLFDLQDGYAFSSKVFTSSPENGRQVIRITDINNQNKNSEKVFIPEEKVEGLGIDAYSVTNGDLLLSLTGAAGFNFYIWENGTAFINQRTMKITPKNSKNESLKVLLSPLIHEKINGIGTGQNNNLSKDALKAIEFPVPQPQEQQKIASCLSSLDELIAAHNVKLDALKDHKKGLLQNLFPQEGETVPKMRFPEFEDDGEWVEETIDSVSLLVTDYVANGSFQSLRENVNVSNQKGYAYYVRLVDLRAGLGHTDQKFVDQSSYQFLGKSSLNGGELLMANIGANVGEVWQMPIVDYPATLAPNMLMIKFESQTTTDFVFQFLQSGYGQRNLSLAISGSGHPKINKTDLKQVNVGIPPTRDEQQKIASCLSAVDELITAQQEKIEQLQQHKKGLMQGLFPKITN